jgi:hypothetical protein
MVILFFFLSRRLMVKKLGNFGQRSVWRVGLQYFGVRESVGILFLFCDGIFLLVQRSTHWMLYLNFEISLFIVLIKSLNSFTQRPQTIFAVALPLISI